MKQPSKKRHKKARWILWSLLVLVLIGGVAAAVRYYPLLNQKRLVQNARELVAKKDYDGATLMARRAVQINASNPEVVRLMVQITEEVRSPAVLDWKRRLVDLDPKTLENHLSLAETALKLGQPAVAEEVLLPIVALGRQSARYHDLNGRAAFATKNVSKAEAEFAEALRLEPGNAEHQLNLGAVQLQSSDAGARNTARANLEKLLAENQLFDRVSRVLVDDALKRGNGERALALGDGLRKATGATFADRMTYLDLLYKINRPAFPAFLTEMQTEAAGKPENLYALITWLNDHNSALIATSWCKTLPPEVTAAMPVPIALAQSYAKISDWVGIKPSLFGPANEASTSKDPLVLDTSVPIAGSWGDREFLRLAFMAAVKRSEGDIKQWKALWIAAVKAASDRPAAISLLARYVVGWGWDNESSELLWKVANGPSDQMWALKILYANYQRTQSTTNLLQVATLINKVDPTDRVMANNVAFLSMLLETNVPDAIRIAGELHKAEPQNPDYLSTYCFALHLQGRSQAAVDLMKTLGPEKLKEPGVAAYYGLFLAAIGATQEAVTYLDLAKDAPLLPEEKKLLARARERPAAPKQ